MTSSLNLKNSKSASLALTVMLVCGIAAVFAGVAEDRKHNETIEKGAVRWSEDLEAARKISAETGRPIFLLFQEIPG